MSKDGIKSMIPYAVAVTSLAVVDLMAIAVINGFKDTGLVDNSTADKFVTGLIIFGTFMGVLVLALVGKIILGLFTSQK